MFLPFKHCHWTPWSGHHWVTIASVEAISAVFGHSVYLRFRDTTTNNALTTIGVVSTMSSAWSHVEVMCLLARALDATCLLPQIYMCFFWENLTFDCLSCLNLDPWYRPCWIVLAPFHPHRSNFQSSQIPRTTFVWLVTNWGNLKWKGCHFLPNKAERKSPRTYCT